jgi:hypothetical protein
MEDGCRVIQECGFSNAIDGTAYEGLQKVKFETNNNNECNSDEDFRVFCDLLKFYNALPFSLIFVTSIFGCK